MVTDITERRDRPEYSLTRIHELARQRSVFYVGNAERDAANLSYGLDDVSECIESLTSKDFRHSERYNRVGAWRDVYFVRYCGPTNCVDELYIKLRLDRDCIFIYLDSFHQQRL